MDEVYLTSQRVNMRLGVFSVDNVSTKLDKIQNIYYKQSFLGRILGYGDLYIQCGATFGLLGYKCVNNPAFLKSAIETAMEDYQDIKLERVLDKRIPQ